MYVEILGQGDDEWTVSIPDAEKDEFIDDLQSANPFLGVVHASQQTLINKRHIVAVNFR